MAGSMILNKDNANRGRDLQAEKKITLWPTESVECFMALVGIGGASVNFFLPQSTRK